MLAVQTEGQTPSPLGQQAKGKTINGGGRTQNSPAQDVKSDVNIAFGKVGELFLAL